MPNISKIRIAAYAVGALVAVAGPVFFAGMMLTGSQKPVESRAAISVVSVDSMAPDFVLPTHDGRTMHLADYRGRAAFLVFVPDLDSADTVAQARSLAKSAPFYDRAGAKVMLIARAPASAAAKWHAANRLPFPILRDDSGALAKRFGVGDAMRRTFVVSPTGQVKFRVDASVIDVKNHGKQLITIGGCCLDDVEASRSDGIGKAVGEYSLPLASNPARAMTTIFGDDTQRATAVLFLSTKCPCAGAYTGRVAAFAKQYATRTDVRLVGVFANADESAEEIATFAKTNGFTFPVLKDGDGLGAKHFGASVTPEAFVLDNSHVLRYAGRIDDSREPTAAKTRDFADAINAVVADKPAPPATRAFGCAVVR